MRELADIVAAFDSLAREGKPAALATVVGVSGSSYRRPGARMLIAADGRTWGSVSGGCLERDVVLRASGVIESNRPVLRRYDTADDEQLASGTATGCGGVVDVFIQPVEAPALLEILRRVLTDRTAVVMATLVRAGTLERIHCGGVVAMVESGGDVETTLMTSALPASLAQLGRSMLTDHDGSPRLVRSADREWFVESIKPSQRLVIFGGGPDAIPMLQIAKTLGWHVTIVAAHPALHARERFGAADAICVTSTSDPVAGVAINEEDAVVVMTHNVSRDGAILAAMPTVPRYLGVLGPRHRSARVIDPLPSPLAESVVSPIGLDLGAETPQEIALAVIAEIQATLRNASAERLCNKSGAIHDRREEPQPATLPRLLACPIF
ncbi:XdhC family protein [soil metagenome]